MSFVPAIHPPAGRKRPALWFIFNRSRLLVRSENGVCTLPGDKEIAADRLHPTGEIFLGFLDEQPCYAETLEDAEETSRYALSPP